MTDEILADLEKEIDRRSAQFQEIWQRTPPVNRARFNDRINIINQSCQNLYCIRSLSFEVKRCSDELHKFRKMSPAILTVIGIIFSLFVNFEFFQPLYYKIMPEYGKIILCFNIWTAIAVSLFALDFSYWTAFEIKNNCLTMMKMCGNSDPEVSSSSAFFKNVDINYQIYNEENTKVVRKEYVMAMIKLLCNINRDMDDEYCL